METLIPVINELQNIFKKTHTGSKRDGIKLPQIVVVGSQSCGKSSVLESLVGKSFLPRGTGIVTRCPIILQLVHTIEDETDDLPSETSEWCSFPSSENPDRKYEDFDEVREEIEKETEKMAGNDRGISMEPITVRVCSPNVISLTVVDLPGVVKNAVGDQPEDIEEQVLNLINQYISNPNAIILAISPANQDIATSESLKIAKAVDPNGDRTLAVITKLDLMDKGTDAKTVLSGQVIQVKLGIIGVVNRSQAAIESNETIEIAMKNEKDFLEERYPNHIGEIGSPYLARRLNDLLMKHIQNSLPDLIKRIGDLTEQYEATKTELGPKVADAKAEKMWVMMGIMTDFLHEYKAAIKDRATGTGDNGVIFTVKITDTYDAFNTKLGNLHNLHALLSLSQTISKELRNSVNIERFTSIERVFKSLVKDEILLMERPSMECAEAVHSILVQAVEHCLKDKRVAKLNAEIIRVTRNLLSNQLKDVKASIKEYMKIQTGMIFSSDNDFLQLLKVSNPADVEKSENKFHFHEMAESLKSSSASFPLGTTMDNKIIDQQIYVKALIIQYFNVMRKQLADYMPKHIMHHLFDCSIDKLRDTIKEAVAGREEDLITEPESVIRKRQETDEMLTSLLQAKEIVSGIQSNYLMP